MFLSSFVTGTLTKDTYKIFYRMAAKYITANIIQKKDKSLKKIPKK